VAEAGSDIPLGLLAALAGAVGIYSVLFATGYFLYGHVLTGTLMSALAVASLLGLLKLWSKLRFD